MIRANRFARIALRIARATKLRTDFSTSFLRISEAQSWQKRNITHQCSHERAPASAHASALTSAHESAHKSWLSLCYNPIQRLPLECSRECSRGCPRKCTQSGLDVCHLVCFHPLCSLPTPGFFWGSPQEKMWKVRSQLFLWIASSG